MPQFIDIHCHCLAGLDDGPADEAQSVELCRALAADGIAAAVATPHQLGRFEDASHVETVRAATKCLNLLLRANDVDLRVLPGGEVRLDERIGRLLLEDKINLLADNRRYLLIELPQQCFIDITILIERLSASGIQVIIAHLERYHFLMQRPSVLHRWAGLGVCFQVTALALLSQGQMPKAVRSFAWHLLESQLPCVVATDAHDLIYRRPMMSQAFKAVKESLGQARARELFIETPRRIVEAKDIVSSRPAPNCPIAETADTSKTRSFKNRFSNAK